MHSSTLFAVLAIRVADFSLEKAVLRSGLFWSGTKHSVANVTAEECTGKADFLGRSVSE